MRICQCWDDGVVDDIRLCEVLRRHGASASFNLNLGLHRHERYHDWDYRGSKPVWKLCRDELVHTYRGFTIANHGFTHPHLPALDDAALAQVIGDGKAALEDHFGTAVEGFAYPFGDHDDRVCAAVAAAGHRYARTVISSAGDARRDDAMRVAPTCHVHDPLFWQHYEQVAASDGVFYFWGHSYELVTEADWWAFDHKIARISADPRAIWCDLPAVFR